MYNSTLDPRPKKNKKDHPIFRDRELGRESRGLLYTSYIHLPC